MLKPVRWYQGMINKPYHPLAGIMCVFRWKRHSGSSLFDGIYVGTWQSRESIRKSHELKCEESKDNTFKGLILGYSIPPLHIRLLHSIVIRTTKFHTFSALLSMCLIVSDNGSHSFLTRDEKNDDNP